MDIETYNQYPCFNSEAASPSLGLLGMYGISSTLCLYKFEMWNWSSNFSACSDFYLQLNVTSNLPPPPPARLAHLAPNMSLIQNLERLK